MRARAWVTSACYFMWNLYKVDFCFFRFVYGGGQNNESVPCCPLNVLLFRLYKMYLQSKSAKPFEVDKICNKCFEHWNKGRWHKSSYCYCASGWRMYVLRTDHHSTGCIKCQRSFTVLIPRYGDSKPTYAYLEAHAKGIFKPTGNTTGFSNVHISLDRFTVFIPV